MIYMMTISLLGLWLLQGNQWQSIMDGALPSRPLDVFLHNLPLLFMYSIPLLGTLFAGLGLAINALIISISIHAYGYTYTLSRLTHFPLELFALVGLMHISKHHYLKRALICSLLLFIAAWIEIHMVKHL